MKYFYHGTDPVRLAKIRRTGLCYGLPQEQRRYPDLAWIYLDGKIDPNPGIYLGETFVDAAMWAHSVYSLENRPEDIKGRMGKAPVAIMRFDSQDRSIRSCKHHQDRIFETGAVILSCPEKCVRPKSEFCFLPAAELQQAVQDRTNRKITEKDYNKIIRGLHSRCKWRPLKWSQP